MSTYTAGRSVHPTLQAGVADTVTLNGGYYTQVEVKNRGTSPIFWRYDGTAAVALANDTFVVMAGEALTIDMRHARTVTVSLVAAGNCDYSVTGF